jgi:hypothetical protein
MNELRPTELLDDTRERPRQGAIYQNVYYIDGVDVHEKDVIVHRILFPHVCILSQDCDLQTDSRNRGGHAGEDLDGALLSVLVAPMYTAAHVISGTHLDRLKVPFDPSRGGEAFKCRSFGSPGKHWKNFVMKNRDSRYHYMEFDSEWGLVPKVIDFKHYFSLSVDALSSVYASNCVCRLGDLDRVHLSQRFASFLSRVGLPDDPESPELESPN